MKKFEMSPHTEALYKQMNPRPSFSSVADYQKGLAVMTAIAFERCAYELSRIADVLEDKDAES